MRRSAYVGLAALGLVHLAQPAFAQTMEDIEAKLKWMSVEVVHYKIVGDYSGNTTLLTSSAPNFTGFVDGEVTDHVEVEFDWNQKTRTLVGTPVIRNTPTKLVKVGTTNTAGCPGAPKVDTAPEFMTATVLTPDPAAAVLGRLVLEGKREQATGTFPTKTDGGCGVVSAKTPAQTVKLQVLAVSPTLLFAPPSDTTRATADKKSIILATKSEGPENMGWTWTITPTPK